MTFLFSFLAVLSDWQRQMLRALGARFSSGSHDAPAELVWTNLPSSWGVFLFLAGVAAAIYGVFAIYRRELAECPRRVKLVLATLRSASVLMLVVILLGPAIVTLQQHTVLPTIVVLRDASQSMSTADLAMGEQRGLSRADAVNRLLTSEDLQLLAQLTEKGRVIVVDFADQVAIVDEKRPLSATGRETHLSLALQHALAADRTAAIVMFTDGQHTGKEDPRLVARAAGVRRVPLFVVGVGDASRRQNVAVVNVSAPPQAWVGEPFEIDAAVRAEGIVSEGLVAELIEQRAGDEGEGSVVQTQRLLPPADGNPSRVQFTHTASADGAFVYRVRVQPPATDARPEDNVAASGAVNVQSREQLRVLLVAGAPSWDYRLIEKLLARDKSIQLSCWLQSLEEGRAQEGNQPISHLPRTKEELLAYDVVLLLDPDPRELDPAWIQLLSQFVGEHGGGLLFMAGAKHSGNLLADARTAAMARLLPVTFGDLQAQQVTALLGTSQRAWPMNVPAASGDHPLVRFFPDRGESIRQWQALPGVLWSFPCEGVKPTAEVLLEHTNPALQTREGSRPLVVAGRYGAGQTVFVGLESTWRWRKAGRQAEFFDKFWVQAVRHLASGRSQSGQRRSSLATDRERYEIGERVALTARLLNEAYEPLQAEQVEASIATSSQTTAEIATLLPVPGRPGEFAGAITARRTGMHEVGLRIESPGAAALARFDVELPSAETAAVWLNEPLLVELASLSGGRYFEAAKVGELAAAVPDRIEKIEARTPPQPIWDTGAMLALLVGLLSSEWLLRKRFQLL